MVVASRPPKWQQTSMPKLVPNTSLAAQGEVAHRLQRHLMPIHNNAKSGVYPSLPLLGFNMARIGGGGGVKNISKLGFTWNGISKLTFVGMIKGNFLDISFCPPPLPPPIRELH